MRLITAAGVLILSTGPALGAYLVDLEGADRMTVDSYWVDGNQMHLMQGGVDLSVPRSRVRSVKETSGAVGSAEAPVRHPSAAPAPNVAASNGSETVQDLQAEQRRIEHHLLRVQQQRFEAKNRNDPPVKQKRLEKEFARTQHRRMGVIREIAER